MKKQAGGAAPELKFELNPDILATVAASTNVAGHPYCVGFAAESENLLEFGAAKREKKGVPLLVGNIGPATFGSDENALLLVDAKSVQEIPKANKLELARKLVAEIAQRMKH